VVLCDDAQVGGGGGGTTREIVVGVGSGGLGLGGPDGPPELMLDIGAAHPASDGALRIRLVLDRDQILAAEPIVGYLHRGAEKLFEVRDYRQAVVLANRHDWLSAFCNELGMVMAVERMLGMEVPVRAVWARTLLAELNRVLNHLTFLGSYPLQTETVYYAFHEREAIQRIMEEASGGRIHFMFNRVGGLKEELPAGWLGRVDAVVTDVRSGLGELDNLVHSNEIFREQTAGVGVLTREQCEQYGVSGPIARASGLDMDLRRDEPYLAYAELGDFLRVVTRTTGDCLARYECLLEQVHVSLDLAAACVERLRSMAPGPINLKLPKVLRAPEGHTYCWTENPLGINGYLLVSRGGKTPWRMKLRSASFNNIEVLTELLPGQRLADLVTILASMFFVVGDIDK
jgi:NADH-quinone oxidoreductase subunit D